MPKSGTFDDNLIEATEAPKQAYGAQEDGTFVTRSGKVLPPKNRNRREAYLEPEEAQIDGHEELVQTPDGSVSFLAVRMPEVEFRRTGALVRKRQPLRYKVTEVYTKTKPRPTYSYDELEQLRKGEMKR